MYLMYKETEINRNCERLKINLLPCHTMENMEMICKECKLHILDLKMKEKNKYFELYNQILQQKEMELRIYADYPMKVVKIEEDIKDIKKFGDRNIRRCFLEK